MDREILTNKVIRHRLKKNQYTNIYIYIYIWGNLVYNKDDTHAKGKWIHLLITIVGTIGCLLGGKKTKSLSHLKTNHR